MTTTYKEATAVTAGDKLALDDTHATVTFVRRLGRLLEFDLAAPEPTKERVGVRARVKVVVEGRN